ncbi:hypothetical protein [Streptomyces sp. NPDC005077]|uniref:hypothetical protein n=1 Tax=Streptomyces sp. NPDC005077 TaxID=3154292 RepID=UPI0033B626D7
MVGGRPGCRRGRCARKRGRDGIAIADQGGWARHSRSMLGYMQRDDGWDDNASAGLT